MNWQSLGTYWVGFTVVIISIAGLANREWHTEFDKITMRSKTTQTLIYIISLVAGAFVLKDQYQASGGNWGGGGGGGGFG